MTRLMVEFLYSAAMGTYRKLLLGSIILLIVLGCGGGSAITSHTSLKPNELKRNYVLYEYYADWCSSCRKLRPVVEHFADNYEGKVKVSRLNIDRHRKLAREKGIRVIPTLVLSDGASDIARSVGYMSYDELVTWVHKVDKGR